MKQWMPNSLICILLVLVCMACTKQEKPETLVSEGYSETEMEAAIQQAVKEVDTFIGVFKSGNGESFSVKAPVSEGETVEHFWLVDISYEAGFFSGKIGNEPGLVKNVIYGQHWKIKKQDISDWMYLRGDKIYGGYTIDPLLATMSAEEAESWKTRLVR